MTRARSRRRRRGSGAWAHTGVTATAALAVATLVAGCQPTGPAPAAAPASAPAHTGSGTGAAVEAGTATASSPPPSSSTVDAAASLDAPGANRIVDWPLTPSPEREQHMLAYRRLHNDPDAVDLRIEPQMIVLHYTGGSSAKATHRYFNRPRIEEDRAKLAAAGVANVSAHFLVDRDGTIYRLLPETTMARHCVGLNHIAIGVENVGDGDAYPLTDAQVEANAWLTRDLVARFGITHLIGHFESPAFDGTPWFVELDPGYRNRKPDPGVEFMRRVRERLTDLPLRSTP